MTQSRPPEDSALDAAFSDMRSHAPAPPERLVTQVVADAMAEMPRPERSPVWKQMIAAVGGWPAMAGLAATACIGIWVGGVLSVDLGIAFGVSQGATLDLGEPLGAFDLILLDS